MPASVQYQVVVSLSATSLRTKATSLATSLATNVQLEPLAKDIIMYAICVPAASAVTPLTVITIAVLIFSQGAARRPMAISVHSESLGFILLSSYNAVEKAESIASTNVLYFAISFWCCVLLYGWAKTIGDYMHHQGHLPLQRVGGSGGALSGCYELLVTMLCQCGYTDK